MELYTLENYLQLYCEGNKSNFARAFGIKTQQANRYFHDSKRELKVATYPDRHELVSVYRTAKL